MKVLAFLGLFHQGAAYINAAGELVEVTASDLITETKATCVRSRDGPEDDILRRTVIDEESVLVDESAIPTNVITITNADFKGKTDPTYYIKEPGTYVLQEDIILDFPEPQSFAHPHHFGFVMGISIAAENVRLNLNDKTIRMSDSFANRQRVFNIIELAQAPYPKGKAGFKDTIIPATNVVIERGYIGRSSHGGIHGNNNNRIRLTDLHIENFEVAGIALNNAKNIVIEHVVIDNRKQRVPVHSNFAIARILDRTLTNIIRDTKKYSGEIRTKAEDYKKDPTLVKILNSPGSDELGFTENKGALPEGSMFGIYISSVFNVGPLGKKGISDFSHNILLYHVEVLNLANGPYERVSMRAGNTALLDSSGNRLMYDFVFNKTGARLPSNPLNDFKFKLTQMQVWTTSIVKPDKIPSDVVTTMMHSDFTASQASIVPLAGVDSRAGHSPKGIFGIRIDAAQNVLLHNCSVRNISSFDDRGAKFEGDMAIHPTTPTVWRGEHGSTKIYKGNYAFGISLTSCVSVDVEKGTVKDVWSKNGNAFGVTFLGSTRGVSLIDHEVSNITVNTTGYDAQPPTLPNIRTKGMTFFAEERTSDIQYFGPTKHAVSHSSPSMPCKGEDEDSTLCPGTRGFTIEEPECGAGRVSTIVGVIGISTFVGCAVLFALFGLLKNCCRPKRGRVTQYEADDVLPRANPRITSGSLRSRHSGVSYAAATNLGHEFRLQTERDDWLSKDSKARKFACLPCIQPEQLKASWTLKLPSDDDRPQCSVEFEFIFQSNYPHVPPKIRQITPTTPLPGLTYAEGGFLILPFENWVPALDMSFCMSTIQDALDLASDCMQD